MSSELDETLSADELDGAPSGASGASGASRLSPSSRPGVELAPGTTFARRYVVEAPIGQGGMGAVYRVRDVKLDEVVALKLLTLATERAVSRFSREVRLARRVTHPNVARTHDLGEHEGVHFLTMELVRGTALDELLEQRGRLPVERAAAIGAQIAAGLDAAHAAGVIHRDLKPANVLIAEDGRVVITDFGIARAASTDTRTHETGALVGTPHYMAPEQVSGRPTDARSDVYALGLILYELVTGALPFDGDSPLAVAVQRLHAPPEDPRRRAEVPDPLAALILRCLARDPDARPPSAAAVRAALEGEPAARSATAASRSSGSRSLYAPMSPGAQALAVLPFVYRGSPDHDYLGEGLAEELIDVLSRTRGLRVLALGATRKFADDRDPARIGAELRADAVVDGTVQLAGRRVRLSARLVETEGGIQRWSERFDGDFADVFELQESMGRRVAEALRLEVDAAAYRRTAPQEAIELYLRARRSLMSDMMSATDEAVRQLEESLALAPGFAPAVAALAWASVRAWWSHEPDRQGERAARARRNVARALEQVPELAESHVAEAMLHVQLGEFREGARAAGRALELVPTLAIAHQYLGGIQCEAGRAKEGKRRLRLALELDPTQSVAHFALARIALLEGDLEVHERHARVLREAFPAPTVPLLVTLLRWALYRDRREEAREHLEALRAFASPAARSTVRIGEIMLGERDAAEADALLARVGDWTDNPRFSALVLQIATELFAAAGLREPALEALGRAADGILVDVEWIRRCPLLEGLRGDPRWSEAERRVTRRAEEVWRR